MLKPKHIRFRALEKVAQFFGGKTPKCGTTWRGAKCCKGEKKSMEFLIDAQWSLKFEHSPPEKYRAMMLGRRSFPFGKVTFQGRTVQLQVGNFFFWCPMKRSEAITVLLFMNFFSPMLKPNSNPMIVDAQVKVRPRSLVQICLQRIAENFLRFLGAWRSRLGFLGGSKFGGMALVRFGEVGWTFCLKIFFWSWDRKGWCQLFNFFYLKSRDINVQKLKVLADVNFCRSTMVSEMFCSKHAARLQQKCVCYKFQKGPISQEKTEKCPPPCLCRNLFWPPRIWQPHYEAGEKTAGGSFCTAKMRFLRVYIEVILKTVKNQGSHDCFFLCIPRSSRQDIYAMLDLDMPLSEAALRTEGRDHCFSRSDLFRSTWLHFGHGKSLRFQCCQNFQADHLRSHPKSCWQWNQEMILINFNQFWKCRSGLLHPTPVFPCSKITYILWIWLM